MNKSPYKNVQNIDMNKTVKIGLCKYYWSEEKTSFAKTSSKDLYCNWNLQIVKVIVR